MKNRYLLILLLVLAAAIADAQNNIFPSTGFVGIGRTNPLYLLHVYRNDPTATAPPVVINDIGGGSCLMAFVGSVKTYEIGVGNGSTTQPYRNQFFINDLNAGKARFMIDSLGTVSIGTTAFNGGGRLTLYPNVANNSGLQFLRLNNTNAAAASNGKVLSLDASGNIILVNDSLGGAASGWSATGNSSTSPTTNFIGTTDNKDLVFRTNNTERFRLLGSGAGYFKNAVGIGTDSIHDTNYRLFVAQGIRTRKVKVDVAAWPDYVFDQQYTLAPLSEVADYISANKHLPGIISAEEVNKEGLNLGDNQADMLKKIEELTLYMIDMQKQINDQKDQISDLTRQLKEKN